MPDVLDVSIHKVLDKNTVNSYQIPVRKKNELKVENTTLMKKLPLLDEMMHGRYGSCFIMMSDS